MCFILSSPHLHPKVLGRNGHRLRAPAYGPPDRLHDHHHLDAVGAGLDSAAARLEGPGVGDARLPGPAVHRVAGRRLPDLCHRVQLLRAAARHTVPVLANIPSRPETDPSKAAGTNCTPFHTSMCLVFRFFFFLFSCSRSLSLSCFILFFHFFSLYLLLSHFIPNMLSLVIFIRICDSMLLSKRNENIPSHNSYSRHSNRCLPLYSIREVVAAGLLSTSLSNPVLQSPSVLCIVRC